MTNDIVSEGRRIAFRMDRPFQACAIDQFLDPVLYEGLLTTFPAVDLFQVLPDIGKKLTFNQGSPKFEPFIEGNYHWKAFYTWAVNYLGAVVRDITGLYFPMESEKRIRFEFSMLGGDGGFLHPHPDTKKKVATVVIYFADQPWPASWGGGTELYRHRRDPEGDHSDYMKLAGEDLELVHRVQFRPNCALAMVRTPYSLHGVLPIFHPDKLPRRSVTINFLG